MGYSDTCCRIKDEYADALDKQIKELEAALRSIRDMKSSPIGDTGFSSGPEAMFRACQRIARKALKAKR